MSAKENINKPVCRLLTELFEEYGITDVVVSPGSRNAPIIVALERSESFIIHYVVDERSAAFFALGIAACSSSPVALVCTSGTAMLNYGPALAEAFYSRIPLIAVTADRPRRWIDQRDSQTIKQDCVLQGILRKSVNLTPDDYSENTLSYHNRLINSALQAATGNIPGPVQINVQLEMPLTPMAAENGTHVSRTIASITPPTNIYALSEMMKQLHFHQADILVYIGGMAKDAHLKHVIDSLLRHNNRIAVVAEVQSNLSDCSIITAGRFNEMLADDPADNLVPDIVITLGGAPVSANIKSRLRSLENTQFFSVGYDDDIVDTYNNLNAAFNCRPTEFFTALDLLPPASSNDTPYSIRMLRAGASPRQGEDFFSNLAQSLHGRHAALNISNGTAIRRSQYMCLSDTVVWCNRGVSGIDGCTSTAMGFACENAPHLTVLLSGDMSAAYDIGALAIKPIPQNFKMIVLDNNGGDIFRRVKTTASLPEREMYFCAMPAFPLEDLARAYGLQYSRTTAGEASVEKLNSFFDAEGPAVLHVFDLITQP